MDRMGERALLSRFREGAPGHPWLLVGPGQDCAILRWPSECRLAFKIDQVVEGVHFVLRGPGAASPRQVGWKAMAKTCSDMAAAGCWPVAATVAAHLRSDLDDAWALELYEGLVDCCKRFGFALAGGDLSSGGSAVHVVVSMLGKGPDGRDGVGEPWLRQGAQPGDALLVTGTLGGSRGGKHLDFVPRIEESHRLRLRAGAGIHAAIDITDGLSRDVGHLCDESGCGVEIDRAALPMAEALRGMPVDEALWHVLADGEDFELLMAVAPDVADRLLAGWDAPAALTRIGRIVASSEGRCLRAPDGSLSRLPDIGYEHCTATDEKNE
jgi:thiamine-monophosphate kinase